MKTSRSLTGLLASIVCAAGLCLVSPQTVSAQFADPGPNFMPSATGQPPTVQRRNQLCIAAWRQSHAFTQQECKGIWVSWDSYTIDPTYIYYDTSEGTHMKYSKCRVHAECRKGLGVSTLRAGEHNAVLNYGDIHKIRRCKENLGTIMNTSCAPLTDADVEAAIEKYKEYWNQQQQQSYGWGGWSHY